MSMSRFSYFWFYAGFSEYLDALTRTNFDEIRSQSFSYILFTTCHSTNIPVRKVRPVNWPQWEQPIYQPPFQVRAIPSARNRGVRSSARIGVISLLKALKSVERRGGKKKKEGKRKKLRGSRLIGKQKSNVASPPEASEPPRCQNIRNILLTYDIFKL